MDTGMGKQTSLSSTAMVLTHHRAAFCSFDLGGFQSPIEVTTGFAHVRLPKARLRGPGAKYQGSYSDDAIQAWAARINSWRRESTAVYVYFDNDRSGYAPRDALRLRAALNA